MKKIYTEEFGMEIKRALDNGMSWDELIDNFGLMGNSKRERIYQVGKIRFMLKQYGIVGLPNYIRNREAIAHEKALKIKELFQRDGGWKGVYEELYRDSGKYNDYIHFSSGVGQIRRLCARSGVVIGNAIGRDGWRNRKKEKAVREVLTDEMAADWLELFLWKDFRKKWFDTVTGDRKKKDLVWMEICRALGEKTGVVRTKMNWLSRIKTLKIKDILDKGNGWKGVFELFPDLRCGYEQYIKIRRAGRLHGFELKNAGNIH